MSFGDEVFQPLRKLEILYLNDNEMVAITPNMLPRLDHLLTLSLADNQIHYLAKDAFNLPRLQHL